MRWVVGSLAIAVAMLGQSSPGGSAASTAALSWKPGPAPLVYEGARMIRLDADRVLVLGSGVASCAGTIYCSPDRNASQVAAVWDIAHGTSRRVADPPAAESLAGNGYSATVDGDVYFNGSTNVEPGTERPLHIVRYDSKANRWDLLPVPSGIGKHLLDYRWTVAAGRPMLVDEWNQPQKSEPAGAILAADGSWHLLAPEPFAGGKERPDPVVVGDQLLYVARTGQTSAVAALPISARGAAGRWRRLPAMKGTRAPDGFAVVDDLLVLPDLVYDPRTGRTTPTPKALRDRDRNSPNHDRSTAVPDSQVVGNRVTLAGALFDPLTGQWTDIPTPPNHDPSPDESKAPDEEVRPGPYDYLGGPTNLVRCYEGELVVTGHDGTGVTETARPGQVDVLRVSA